MLKRECNKNSGVQLRIARLVAGSNTEMACNIDVASPVVNYNVAKVLLSQSIQYSSHESDYLFENSFPTANVNDGEY